MIRFRRPTWLENPRAQIALIVALSILIVATARPTYHYLYGSWHWQKAQTAIAARDFRTARRHLDICRSEWPDSGETAFLAARTARRSGDLETGYRYLNDARRLNWVREELDMEVVLIAVRNGDFAPHTSYLLSCVQVNHPGAILILEVLEPAALANLDLPLAGQCLELWIKLEPANPHPYLERGDLKQRYRNLTSALDDYEVALNNGSENAETHRRLGDLLLELRRPTEALPHYEWLAQKDAGNLKTRLGLARCYYGVGQKGEARTILDQLLKDDPKNGGAMALRGEIEQDLGRPEEAEQWFRNALKNMPNEIDVMYKLYQSLNAQGKTKEAEEARKKMEAAKTAQAEVADYFKKIRQNPTDPEPLVQVAIRMIEHGMEDEGKRWLELALKRDPRYAPTYEGFAKYYDQMQDPASAKAYRDLAKSLAPKSK